MEALILFNFSVAFVSIFVLLRFERGSLKTLFLMFAGALCLYATASIALREFESSPAEAEALARLVLLGGALVQGSLLVLLARGLNLSSLSPYALLVLSTLVGIALALSPFGLLQRILAFSPWLAALAGVAAFSFLFLEYRKCENEYERFRFELCAWAVAPFLVLYFLSTAVVPAWTGTRFFLPGPLFLLPAVVGLGAVIHWSKQLFLLRKMQGARQDSDLLFEDRFPDLVRGVVALRDVLLDRKISAGRLLILNAEENLSIERTSSQTEAASNDLPCGRQCETLGHLTGVLENYARLERRVSLMNFALMRYENMALEQEEEEQQARKGSAEPVKLRPRLRLQDPLLVLYHYLREPECAFALSDALDVIEREELQRLMDAGYVVRRPGAGLALTHQALARVAGQTGVLSTTG